MPHRLVLPQLVGNNNEAWATIDTFIDREMADKARTESLKNHRAGDSVSGASGNASDSAGLVPEALAMSEGLTAAIVGGVLLGLLTVLVGIWTDYMVTVRSGICVNAFWLNRRACCPRGEEDCESWVRWGEFFAGKDSRHVDVLNVFAFLFIGTMSGVAAAVLCKYYSIFASGGGINEVKTVVSGHVFERYFSGWTTIIKMMTVSLSTSCGLAVGKEGPFVHMGACIGDLISGLFPSYENESMRRELVAAGAGAGVAAAFGSPIGGVLFAIEEITPIFSFRVVLQSLIFGVVAILVVKQFDISHTGRIVQLSINYVNRWYWFELPLFAIVGIVCGYVASAGSLLNVAIVRARRLSTHWKRWPVTEVAVQTIISNIVNHFIPAGKLALLEVLSEYWNECVPDGEKTSACSYSDFGSVTIFFGSAFVRTLLNCFAVGLIVPTGVLVNSLVVGALLGRSLGVAVSALQTLMPDSLIFAECAQATSCVHPNTYAVVGGAAFLTGYTRMTVCLAVITFELTGGIEFLVPVIIGIMCAKWAGESIGVESWYEINIEENKMPFIDPKMEFHHPATAADILGDKKFVSIPATGLTIVQLNDFLAQYSMYSGFAVVVPETNEYLGYAWRKSIIAALRRCETGDTLNTLSALSPVVFNEDVEVNEPGILDLTSLVLKNVIVVAPVASVQQILNLFKSLGSRQIIVTHMNRFRGIITKKDLLTFMRKIHSADHAEH